MKRILGFATCLVIAASAQSQVNSCPDGNYYCMMKSDEVLQSIYQDVAHQVDESIKYNERINAIAAPIRAQADAEVKHIYDSLGVTYIKDIKDPVVFHQCELLLNAISNKYGPLENEAVKDIRIQYSTLLEAAFNDAARKYYENADKMKSNQ